MGQALDFYCEGVEFTQSYRPEEAIPDSQNKCEPGLTFKILAIETLGAKRNLNMGINIHIQACVVSKAFKNGKIRFWLAETQEIRLPNV